jgi:hypothetical protein
MGKPLLILGECVYMMRGEVEELKHLSTLKKRKRSDSLSSGERKGNSLNLICCLIRLGSSNTT